MNEKQIVAKYMSGLGKKSAESLTKEQRSERARKAVQARWNKRATVDNSLA